MGEAKAQDFCHFVTVRNNLGAGEFNGVILRFTPECVNRQGRAAEPKLNWPAVASPIGRSNRIASQDSSTPRNRPMLNPKQPAASGADKPAVCSSHVLYHPAQYELASE